MSTLGFLRRILKQGLNWIGMSAPTNELKTDKIYRNEATTICNSQSIKYYSDSQENEHISILIEQPISKVSSPETSNSTIKILKKVSNDPTDSLPVGKFLHDERINIEYSNGIIKHTFIHLKGIGHEKESALWRNEVLNYDDALNKNILPTRKKCLENSKKNLESRNWQPFYEGMNSKDHWRLFGDLINETAYIDIETTGLSSTSNIITTVVVHSLRSTHVFVNGMNLDILIAHLSQFNLIITYNGKSFDIPFIEKFFNTTITTPHIDLRYVLAGMGYKGGLKSCEQQLKLPIRKAMDEIDGYTAILLWKDYCKTNDPRALETLLAYNYEDSVRLEWLMIEAYNQKVSGLPFNSEQLYKPCLPNNPYRSHSAVLKRIL